MDSYPLGYKSPLLTTPGAATRQLRTALMAQNLRRLFKLTNPKSVYATAPILSTETTLKAVPMFSLHSASLCGPCNGMPISRDLWVQKSLSSWQSFPCLCVFHIWWKRILSTLKQWMYVTYLDSLQLLISLSRNKQLDELLFLQQSYNL